MRQVCRAVSVVANTPAPWAVCLPKALAAHWMLRRRRISSAVCFGVKHDPATGFGAHAWLRVGDEIVMGGRSLDGYAPIAEFPVRAAASVPPADVAL